MGEILTMSPRIALVLMYHQIVPDGAPAGWVPSGLADPRYGVRISRFRDQMELIASRGLRVARLSELLEQERSFGSSEPAIVLTFDDGYDSDFSLAAPVLRERGFPATFFLATDHLGLPGMMTVEKARTLSSDGLFSIGSHGGSHRFLSVLSAHDRQEELLRSLDTIRALSGSNEVDLSAPGGRTSARVQQDALMAGFRSLSTSTPGVFESGTDPFSIPRLPILHGHSLQRFEALLDPGSFAFRIDAAVRNGKSAIRKLVSLRTTAFSKATP